MMHNLPTYCSASEMFTVNRVADCKAVIRNLVHRFMMRLMICYNCNKIIMLAGDFNLPDIDWTIPTIKNKCRTPAIHSQLLNTLADHSLTQLNQTATRENNILDLITTNSPNLVNRIEILPGISDHHAIFTEVNTMPLVGKKQRRSIFLHNRTNTHGLKQHFKTFADRFEHTFQTATVDEMWDALRATINEGMQTYVPSKYIKPHDQLPWITRTNKTLIKKRNKAYCTMKHQPTPENISKFKSLKRKAQHSIRHSYEQYLTDIVNPTVDHGNKKLWSLIRAKRRDTTRVTPLKENGELVQQPLDKANVLNRQFKSAFSPITTEHLPDIGESPYPQMQNITVTVPGVEKLLLNLKPHKAAGPDAILPRTLKDFATEIAPVLTFIYNKSLSSSTIPDDWRTANVTPIFKKGERYLPSNYRPISLTCICCKIQEHIIVSNIMAHLDKHSILYRWQYGFRAKHSTDTQLTTFVHELSQNLDQRKQTDVIILDFSKAFDKVSHKHLALKLKYYGINKIVLDWINSFLTSRTQRVILDGATSDKIQVTSGVPQGSVLGPILFLLYINDLPTETHSHIRLFADDAILYREIKSNTDCTILQEDLNRLANWETKWLMEFNPSKCQILSVTRKKCPIKFPYKLHNEALENVKSAKYLGITITSDLSWNKHIATVTSKANKALGFVKRNIHSSSELIKTRAYQAIVRPSLEYATCVWDPHTQIAKQKLEAVQRRAARYVTRRYHNTSSVTNVLRHLEWQTLEQRRIATNLTMLYKITNNIVTVPIHTYLTPWTRPPTRSHNLCYMPYQCNTNTLKYSFFPRTIILWNSLPSHIASAPTLNLFKDAVFTWTNTTTAAAV